MAASKYREKKKNDPATAKRNEFERLPKPRTENQQLLVDALRKNTITVVEGPAGTGKTMLTIAEAIRAQVSYQIHKIVILRPLITVGEDLGFLPGSLNEKITPYLQHILEYFEGFLDKRTVEGLMKAGVIELVPFALVRGRTFKESFIIVDEAQNATKEQMKAILTRIGEDSKMAILGDTEQSDIYIEYSGLNDLLKRIKLSDEIGVVTLERKDIQRNPLINEILDWYK